MRIIGWLVGAVVVAAACWWGVASHSNSQGARERALDTRPATQRASFGRSLQSVDTDRELEVRTRLAALLSRLSASGEQTRRPVNAGARCVAQVQRAHALPASEATRVVDTAFADPATEEGLLYVDSLSAGAGEGDATEISLCALAWAQAFPD